LRKKISKLYSLVNLTLNMRYKMTKNIKFVITTFVFSSSKCAKIRFRSGLRPGPRWGSLRRSPRPLVGWGGGYPLPIPLPARRLRRLELGYGASVLRPPQHKILATPMGSPPPPRNVGKDVVTKCVFESVKMRLRLRLRPGSR